MKQRAILNVLLTTLTAMSVCPPTWACGMDGGLGDAWSAAHEGSLDVAFATSDAMRSGLLAADPELGKDAAHLRADERVVQLATKLTLNTPAAQSFAILVVETGIWTRISTQSGRWPQAVHIEKPEKGDTVVLASAPALRNLISGQLSADGALAAGVLAIPGQATERTRLLTALRQTYPERSAQTASR